jgi:hypothetical protein
MAQDDPVPGSSWNGGHWYGEPIPKATPKKKAAPLAKMSDQQGIRQTAPGVRRDFLKGLQQTHDTKGRMMSSQARRKAIASLTNRQDT